MTKMNRKLHWAITLFGILILLGVIDTRVSALDPSEIDLESTGSISIFLKESEGDAIVSDGELTIYHIASLIEENGEYSYKYEEEYLDCGISLKRLAMGNASAAQSMATWIVSQHLTGTPVKISEDGKAEFTDLELGLYFIVQTVKSEGFYSLSPFAVTIPLEGDEAWIYDVDASPKVEVLKEVPNEPPEDPDEPPDEPDEPPDEPDEPGEPDEPDEPVPTPSPQTGDMNRPVIALMLAGILFVSWIVVKKWSLNPAEERKGHK